MSKERVIEKLKRLDDKCCELHSIWVFLEDLKIEIARRNGLSNDELKKNHIFILDKEAQK